MLNLGHMPNTVGNLYVHKFNTSSNGYVDIKVPEPEWDRNSLLVYGDGNGFPFHGVIGYSDKQAVSNVAGGASPTSSMINSTTLRFNLGLKWSAVYVVSDFKVS